MKNIAEFRIIGRIGKIEAREKVTFVDVAANYGRKVDGQWQDDTHWNHLTCFGKTAQRVAGMSKGDLVHATGRVRQSNFEKDGQRVYGVELIIDRIAVIAKNGQPASDTPDTEE